MDSARSALAGALLEFLAFGISALVSLFLANRTGAFGHPAVAASMAILAMLALWRAWTLRAGEAPAPTTGARMVQSVLALTSIVLLLSGIYLNVAV